MTPPNPPPLQCALDALGWTLGQMGRYLGVSGRTMHRAIRGDLELPPTALVWFAYLSGPVDDAPPPPDVVLKRLGARPLPVGWGAEELPLTIRARPARGGQKAPEGSGAAPL